MVHDKLDGGAGNDNHQGGDCNNDTLTGGSGTDYDRSKGETQVNIP